MEHRTYNMKYEAWSKEQKTNCSILCAPCSMNGGQAALTAVLFFLVASTALAIGFTSFAFTETRDARRQLHAKQSYFLAEAGSEDVAYRYRAGKTVGDSETITIDDKSVTTTTVTLPGGEKEITAKGDVNSNIRKIRTILETGVGTSFSYGVQVGNGGLTMANSSKVNGSVYSNGNITGNNSPRITGDAFAAGTSIIKDEITVDGNARAYAIENITIRKSASSTTYFKNATAKKNAYAGSLENCTVDGNAFYDTTESGCTIGGTATSGQTPPAALDTLEMPIPDEDLDMWEQEAEDGGVISSPCPYELADNDILGPAKITCDVLIDGVAVTLAGPLWIVGNFEMRGNAKISLDASYGDDSEIIIVDDPSNRTTSSKIILQNSAVIEGSGTEGSYVLIVSRNESAENGGGEIAIDIKNSSNAPIYYAPHGKINIQNNTSLKEVTGYQLHMQNSAAVTYETGLANMSFSSGPTGGWEILSWREVE